MRVLLLASFVFLGVASPPIVLPPLDGKQSDVEIAFILIQGASCPSAGYKPLAEAIQKASPHKVWVGIPQFAFDTPNPVVYGHEVDVVMNVMQKAGAKPTHKVIGAHSLGAVMSQVYLTTLGGKTDALVLMGATVLRSNRNSTKLPPTLTLDGDLDGLLHVTRQAEAYYHQVQKVGGAMSSVSAPDGRPVVLIEGANHWSFSSGDKVPSNVQKNDIKAEICSDEAHSQFAEVIADFMAAQFDSDDAAKTTASQALAAKVEKTGKLLAPVLEALYMEGYHFLEPPCESDYPTNPTCNYPKYPDRSLLPRKGPPNPLPPSTCTCGSPWVEEVAAKMMAGFDQESITQSVELVNKDAFHDVSDVRPFHLPHIFDPAPGKACSSATSCKINSTTVSMPVYESADKLDTGLYPVTANEFRTKLKSREAYLQAAGLKDVNYTATDKDNQQTCRKINEAAYQWALDKASPKALARFKEHGQPFTFADDLVSGIGLTGPTWIHDALSFKPTTDKKSVEVQSHMFATQNKNLGDVSFLETVGYHYCKLLSPARAMEWIYVDGLKQFNGLPPSDAMSIMI